MTNSFDSSKCSPKYYEVIPNKQCDHLLLAGARSHCLIVPCRARRAAQLAAMPISPLHRYPEETPPSKTKTSRQEGIEQDPSSPKKLNGKEYWRARVVYRRHYHDNE
ncbi:MAG: hypothetical protein GY874_11015 [Desulfobacteraceae bacterium]|nr:hypothetical protein [Desulfobacteraceae bacterium]